MDAHGHPSTGAFAEALKRAAREHYGHAARRFLACLCEDWGRRDDLARKLQAMETEWMDRTIPAGVDPQVRRVGGRFALVAVAGELAREMGILPWPEGEASRAAAHCFRAWLDRRGHASSSETVRAVQAVIDFLGKLDTLPQLKLGDSPCGRLVPEPEVADVPGGVDISVVMRAADRAGPRPLIQTCAAFRPSHAVAC